MAYREYELVHGGDSCPSIDEPNLAWLARLHAAPESDALRYEYAEWLDKRG